MKKISTLTAILASAFIGIAGNAFAQKAETPKAAPAAAPAKAAAPAAAPAAKMEAKAEAKAEIIDINSADKKTLMTLPGIGEAYAKAIMKNRPYSGKDDLMTASNKSKKAIVPEKTYDGIKDLIIAKQAAKKADKKEAGKDAVNKEPAKKDEMKK